MIKKIGNVSVIQLSPSDSNIYLLDKVVIDSGTGFNFTRLMSMFNAMKIDMGSIEWVINTHGHYDHIGGNGYFLNAKVAIHELDAPILEKGDEELSFCQFFDGKMHKRQVDRKLRDGDEINGLKVIHTPGHSAGSICLYDEKNKILFSGDTVFAQGIGRTDLPGGNEDDMKGSLNKLKGLKIDKLLPGHGEPALQNVKLIIDSVSDDFY
jgi:glyoxylase-like metal-dependent hydrolase (beta-lactamase superfamily II)